jgi:hypothetical protein
VFGAVVDMVSSIQRPKSERSDASPYLHVGRTSIFAKNAKDQSKVKSTMLHGRFDRVLLSSTYHFRRVCQGLLYFQCHDCLA